MKKRFLIVPLAALIGGVAGFAMGWKHHRPEISMASPDPGKKELRESPTVEAGESKEAISASKTSAASPSGPASVYLTPKKRFLELAFQRWPPQARRHLLWDLFLGNPEGQRRLFESLMSSTDPADWIAGQDFLIGTLDADLVRRMADAFASETHPDRRAMLAYALGGNASHAEAHPGIEAALNSQDEALLKRVLTRLTMANLKEFPDSSLRVEAGLKRIIGSALNREIRVAAVRSLMGAATEDRTRYLLDLALRDPNPAMQRAAVGSLPIQFMSHPPLLDEQVQTLWILARDESRDEKLRRSAASRLRDHTRFKRVNLNEVDQALLNGLLETKK